MTVPTITKQNNKRTHSYTKLPPRQSSFEKNEGFVYQNFLEKCKKTKRKYKKRDLVKQQIWRERSQKVIQPEKTEILNDTIPNCKIDVLEEGYNEALLNKTKITLKENTRVMKALNLN